MGLAFLTCPGKDFVQLPQHKLRKRSIQHKHPEDHWSWVQLLDLGIAFTVLLNVTLNLAVRLQTSELFLAKRCWVLKKRMRAMFLFNVTFCYLITITKVPGQRHYTIYTSLMKWTLPRVEAVHVTRTQKRQIRHSLDQWEILDISVVEKISKCLDLRTPSLLPGAEPFSFSPSLFLHLWANICLRKPLILISSQLNKRTDLNCCRDEPCLSSAVISIWDRYRATSIYMQTKKKKEL